jgi:hypothetical protein
MLKTDSLANSDIRLPLYPLSVHESAKNEAVSSRSALDFNGVKKRRCGSRQHGD